MIESASSRVATQNGYS